MGWNNGGMGLFQNRIRFTWVVSNARSRAWSCCALKAVLLLRCFLCPLIDPYLASKIASKSCFIKKFSLYTKMVIFRLFFLKFLPAIFSMVGPFAGLFCCERYCCEINCGTRPLKLLKGTNPFIWYPAIIIDILELSLSLLWNFILWKISNQSFIFIRSDQKDFVKRGGTNPKAKYYEYLSPRAFLETAPPWTMFAFCSTKDNVGCSYDSSSKKSFAHSKSDEIRKP